LREGDRVEIYRGLVVDPKEARRLRYQKHRAQTPAATRRGR
jgi:putative ubiquitin-RnfH superfamily antitoxin RatB of RatAB toxin-antitoxin module